MIHEDNQEAVAEPVIKFQEVEIPLNPNPERIVNPEDCNCLFDPEENNRDELRLCEQTGYFFTPGQQLQIVVNEEMEITSDDELISFRERIVHKKAKSKYWYK